MLGTHKITTFFILLYCFIKIHPNGSRYIPDNDISVIEVDSGTSRIRLKSVIHYQYVYVHGKHSSSSTRPGNVGRSYFQVGTSSVQIMSSPATNEMKQVIAVDIDEVLAQFMPTLARFHNDNYNTSLVIEDFQSYRFNEVWGGN